jgi:hypothetical protein
MNELPSRHDAERRAREAANNRPQYVEPQVVATILKAIGAGKMSVVVHVTADLAHTINGLKSQGYVVSNIRENRLHVSWGMSDAETSKAYWESR